jgi:plasmid stabilization system protein ParE
MKLRIARSAAADLDEIWIHTARSRSFEAAEHLVSLLMGRFGTIASHPGIGKERADLGENVRALVAGSYRIYYRQERNGIIRMLHVRHAARDETKLFGPK